MYCPKLSCWISVFWNIRRQTIENTKCLKYKILNTENTNYRNKEIQKIQQKNPGNANKNILDKKNQPKTNK